MTNVDLEKVVRGIVSEETGTFNIQAFFRDVLGLNLALISDVHLALGFLFVDPQNLRSLRAIQMNLPVIYEYDLNFLAEKIDFNKTRLNNLVEVSFNGACFRSNKLLEKTLEMRDFLLETIAKLPSLRKLNLSYSNFLEMIKMEDLEKFCDAMKSKDNFEYLGLAAVIRDYRNIRKYEKILSSLPA